MLTAVLVAAAIAYLAAALAFGVTFVRPAASRAAAAGYALLASGFAVHGVAIGLGCQASAGRHLLTVAGLLGLAGWIGAGALLLVQRLFAKPAFAAVVLPVVLAVTVPSLLASHGGTGATSTLAALPVLQLHVTTAAAGMALFGLACAVGLLFLLQDRQLKAKRFGPLFSRLPALLVLDRIGGRLAVVGFVLFTVAIVSGAAVATSVWCAPLSWDGQQVASLAAWLVLGAVVLARTAGRHGRRQAVLTIVAFTLVLGGLTGVRLAAAGTTRHTALDAAAPLSCAPRT